MKTPFTADQFLDVFKNYNESVFPTQFILYLLSFIAIYFALKHHVNSGRVVSGLIAFFWLWMGMVYHLLFFTEINKAAYIFGGLFILQAILFLAYGVVNREISFGFQLNINSLTGLLLIVFSLIIYPVLGYVFGHRYPASPTFGLPCPTTIFTFGILLLTDKKYPVALIIIPFIWSLIGFTAVFQFGIWEDAALLFSGLITVSLQLIKNRKSH